MEEKIIVRYYRKGYKVPRGCVVGVVLSHIYTIGYSLYHKKLEKEAGVSFTKKRARIIAEGRARKYHCTNFPQSLVKTARMVEEQCNKMLNGGKENAREDVTSTDKD